MAVTMQMQHASQVRGIDGVDIVAGLWLLAAPFIFNYAANGGSRAIDIVVGIVVLLMAGIQMMGDNYRLSWPSWISGLAGLWLIVAPFAMGFPSGSAAMWNDVILGVIVVLLAASTGLTGDMDIDEGPPDLG